MNLTISEIPLVAAQIDIWDKYPNLFEDVLSQLNKDLSLAGAPYELNASSPNELLEQVESLCGHLSENNGEHFASLLYRIDLKTEDLPYQGFSLEGKDLAKVMLKREAMKVLFRRYYST